MVMRYFIKAYPMHENEVALCHGVAGDGRVENAEFEEGLMRGIADEATIKHLADSGVVVQPVAAVPDPPTAASPDDDDESSGGPRAGVRGLGAAPSDDMFSFGVGADAAAPEETYVLAELPLGVTEAVIAGLSGAGAEIVERDPSGSYVLRAGSGTEALRALPFVGEIRPYGVEETIKSGAEAADDAAVSFGLESPARRSASVPEPARST
jgi:hypothetical protein